MRGAMLGAGWARACPSPNFGPRRDGLRPELIVLHYTAMQDARAALDRLCDPRAEVSAHYLIGACGTLWQLVGENRRAWHAGAGCWAGRGDVNSRSIGIELDNRGDHPFAAAQMATLERLLPEIMARWAIPPDGVIGHSDMAPGRKSDPGPRFDWARLERLGLARPRGAQPAGDGGAERAGADIGAEIGAETGAAAQARFRALATACGWCAETPWPALLAAVRLRLRPGAAGGFGPRDLAALARFAGSGAAA